MLTGRERRILVLGNSGSGKSTLTRRLSEALGLPAVHLDAAFWRPGWTETPGAEWDTRIPALCAGPRWVQDGNFARSLPQRLLRADTVVLFERPTVLCLWRILRRWWTYRGVTRPDLARACPEKLDLTFLHWVMLFRWRELPRVHAALREAPQGLRVLMLRREQDVEALLESARQLGAGVSSSVLRSALAAGAPHAGAPHDE